VGEAHDKGVAAPLNDEEDGKGKKQSVPCSLPESQEKQSDDQRAGGNAAQEENIRQWM
jgi:hypothetical protein